MHQLDGFVGVQQPDVNGFSFQNFSELRSNEWQQLCHLQRRRKYFFQIVELRKTGDGFQCAMALIFITLRSSNGGGTQGRCGLQSNDDVVRQAFIERKNFKSAYQRIAVQKRNVTKRLQTSAYIDVRIIFALQGCSSAQL